MAITITKPQELAEKQINNSVEIILEQIEKTLISQAIGTPTFDAELNPTGKNSYSFDVLYPHGIIINDAVIEGIKDAYKTDWESVMIRKGNSNLISVDLIG